MNINNISLSRMSTIFCLLISISSLHKAFISLGLLLKGSSSLPWLISSQPHRSQAFPTQCSLCSHKDPRNPAACPQLIFPVAILLTQPPTGRGCKCKARNRPLCVHPPPPLHCCRSVNHCRGLNHCPLSASRTFQPPSPSTDQTTWPPCPSHHEPHSWVPSQLPSTSTSVCFCLSNLSCVLLQWPRAQTGRSPLPYIKGAEHNWNWLSLSVTLPIRQKKE